VSAKPQATRKRVHGVVSDKDYQIVFADSPGFLSKGMNSMTSYISGEAQRVIEDVDAIVLLVPADLESDREVLKLVEAIEASKKPFMFCMSKSDLKKSDAVEKLLFVLSGKGLIGFPLSIKKTKREQVKEILRKMSELLPETTGPLYDAELYTTERTRDIASEMIREQCFELLDKELPYGLGVSIQSFKEEEKIIRIEATIIVERDNHKGIVIGKGGAMLKKIGETARKRIEAIVGQKIFLGLHVSHKADWTKQKRMMKEMGYGDGN
jgi:GTPase